MAHDALQTIEFTNRPAVLVLADTAAAGERARRAVDIAGCRVSDVAPIEDAVERLGRQAGLDAAFIELDEDHGPLLDALLEELARVAEAGGHASIVSAPRALVDPIARRAWHRRVIHLCEPSEMERVAAVAVASARRRHMLNDIGKDEKPPKLKQLSEEVGRIATILASLSGEETRPEADEPEETVGKERRVTAGMVRAIIRARRLREQHLGKDLFADPAWDIMLDLFAAKLEKRRVAVSSLCIAAAVPPTTALRWIKTLTDCGHLVRAADPQDGRRVYIELSPKAAAGMEAYLRAVQRISPLAP